jgi:hypothetical protein
MQVDEIVEKIYANMSACHLKNENWQRAVETANKVGTPVWPALFFYCSSKHHQALAKNEDNYKAMFRKGKALGELGFFDKAEKVLEELKTKSPSGLFSVTRHPSLLFFLIVPILDAPGATAEIARLRALDQAREKAHKLKLKGLLLPRVASCFVILIYIAALSRIFIAREAR